MKNFNLTKLNILFIVLLSIAPDALADLSPVGVRFNSGEIKVEVLSTEFDSSHEEEALEAAEAEIVGARKSSPSSIVELGWFHANEPDESDENKVWSLSRLPELNRSPAAWLPRAKAFIQKLEGRLNRILLPVNHSFGLVRSKADASSSFYLKNSNAIYTTVRLTHSYVGRVATFVFAGYGLSQSIELGLAVAISCGVISANYDWMMKVVKHERVYDWITPGSLPGLDRLRADPVKAAKLDRLHGKVNWSIFEVAFTLGVLGLESGFGKLMALPVPFPSVLDISFSVFAALNSQQVWDRAVSRYEDLLDLDPELNADFKSASLRKRRAIGSVVSVVAMTASSMNALPIKIGGFALLLGLRQAGVYYEKAIDGKIAESLANVKPCDLLTTQSKVTRVKD